MWCTRWFVPLLLLPLPSAPPYFLLVFLTSLVVHARPCFYCILLLSALFVSSCHWSPLTLGEPLSQTIVTQSHANLSTFGDALTLALAAMHVSVPKGKLPAIIHLQDRCWCDPAVTTLFEPFDILAWELQGVAKAAMDTRKLVESPRNVTIPTNASTDARTHDPATPRKRGFLSLFAPFTHRRQRAAAGSPEQSNVEQAEAKDPRESPRRLVEPHPWDLDMRPYGFPIILDFTWWRRPQRAIPFDQVRREVEQALRI